MEDQLVVVDLPPKPGSLADVAVTVFLRIVGIQSSSNKEDDVESRSERSKSRGLDRFSQNEIEIVVLVNELYRL